MTTGWRATTLGDLEAESNGVIQTGPFGSQLHMSDYSPVGTPVVMPTNIKDLRIDPGNIARVDDGHVERLARHKLRPGDIVYSRRGDVEKCALIRDDESGWLCGTGCLLVRVGGAGVDTRFLAYSLSQPETRAWISLRAVGATMPNLNTGILREVPVVLPPIEVQRGIAATLGALDDKVESNSRCTSLLSQLGSALFDQSLAAARAEATLDDLAEHRPGKYLAREAYEPGDYVVYGSNSVMGKHSEALYDGPLAILARIGSNCGALQWSERGAWVNNNASALVRCDGVSPWVLWHVLKSVDMRPFRAGSGQPFIQINDLMKSTVTVPPMGEETWLSESLRSMSLRAESLRQESHFLVNLRDALLPELLAGRIRVPEAERVIAGVGA